MRFAIVSLVVIAALAGGAIVTAHRLAADTHEQAFARETAALLKPPIDNAMAGAPLTGPLPDAARTRADIIVWTLLSETVRGVRVKAHDGTFLYASGAAASEAFSNAPTEVEYHRSRTIEGQRAFFTSIPGDGYTVEVAQDPTILNDAIRQSRTERIVLILILSGAAWLLCQGAFWLSVRTLASEHDRLATVSGAGNELRSSLDLNDVLSKIARDATSLADAQYGLVSLYDEPSTELILRVAYDRSRDGVIFFQRAIDDWFMRRCVATKETVSDVQDLATIAKYFGEGVAIEGPAPVLCVPMLLAGRVIGIVAIARAAEGRPAGFGLDERKLIEDLASHAVTAVEQALLFNKMRGDANEIEASYDSTLKALMAALDAKDEGTEGHCERVARLTVHLARTLEMPEDQLVHVERGALLHDVGKIGVPDGILKKRRKLNEAEWEAMRKHPLLAGLMVSKIGFLEPALPILLYHHERFDGTGYPFGLKGENIPLEARIFSVVDAYDAMTSERPYREAMPHRDAMDEIRAHSEAQFDPEIVAAFEALMASRPDLRVNVGGRTIMHTHDEDLDPTREDHPDESVA